MYSTFPRNLKHHSSTSELLHAKPTRASLSIGVKTTVVFTEGLWGNTEYEKWLTYLSKAILCQEYVNKFASVRLHQLQFDEAV